MAYEKSSTKDFFFIFLRCTFCIIKTGNTPLLFIALSLLAASAWPTCIASLPKCDQAQELLGKINLTEAVEKSDVIAPTTRKWDGSRGVFELDYPHNYKKLRVSKEIVIDGYNNFSKVEIYYGVVFLTKHNESSFQLYSQNNQELVPLEFTLWDRPIMIEFLDCVVYLLLEEQEPEIVVNQYLQKAWDVQDKYYFETGNQVILSCIASNLHLLKNAVWHLPEGKNFSGYNITVDQEGKYSCKFSIDDKESLSSNVTLEALGKTLNFTCESKREDKHNVDCNYTLGTLTLKLKRPSVLEAGTHSLTATIWKDGTSPLSQKTLQMQLVVLDHDLDIILSLETLEGVQKPKDQILQKTQQFYLKCKITGHPVTDIFLEFKPCASFENCSSPSKVLEKVMVNGSSDITSTVGPKVRIWKDSAEAQGIYQCIGRNKHGNNFLSNNITVAISDYGQLAFMTLEAEVTREESEELIHVNSSSSVIEVIMGDKVLLKCRKNKMANLTDEFMWTSQDIDFHQENITKQEEDFSEVLEWRLDPDLLKYNGTKIRCLSSDERLIIIQEAQEPKLVAHEPFEKVVEGIGSLDLGTAVNFSCRATGVPDPIIRWTKDDEPLKDERPRVKIEGSTLSLFLTRESDSGLYKCNVSNRAGWKHDYVNLIVATGYHSPVVIYVILGLCIIALVCGIVAHFVRKDKRKRNFMLEEVEQFMKGAPDRLNPELGLTQQAHLLPCDMQFEIARSRIEFGKLIGEGEFGHVFQAKVDGLRANELQTTVAVKTAKSRSNEVFRKELIAEVKIMMHIGRHANVLNLLGICSENLATKGELLVIIEYCRHGNLRDYLLRHRNNFVLDKNATGHRSHSDRKAESSVSALLCKDETRSSHPASSASGSDVKRDLMLNDIELSHLDPPYNPHQFATSSASDHAPSVYSDMTPMKENLTQSDLISWSYQIGKGMDYLSMRKVVHGDLAARNVLLDERYIVKISDFGFAKDVYHKNYMKSGQSSCLMPVKWMSPEYLKDQIRSIQSDIWAYGVLLWEIFSLGETPYQGFIIDDTFMEKIENGYRLPCPNFAPEKVYNMMRDCWQIDPMARPPFSDLVKKMIRLLSSGEREYFKNMNKPYDEQRMSEFLASIVTPNYTNLTSARARTPSAFDPEILGVSFTHVCSVKSSSPKTKRTSLGSITSLNSSSDADSEAESDGGYLCMNPIKNDKMPPNQEPVLS
ncbi:vascular endothelial growth factor receptor 1-like isoform X2 [Palaemon carinicauda]|uniref:vascular endothelial growth factor receptor 1-like isoform X2 n=1 Tax=Palaemon carinicauda TaxID=392227 RepID=UPI0035B66BB8